MKTNDYRTLITILGLWIVLETGCTIPVTIALKDTYRQPETATYKAPAVLLHIEEALGAPNQQQDQTYLGEGVWSAGFIAMVPFVWRDYEYHSDYARAELVRDAVLTNLKETGLPTVFRPIDAPAELKSLAGGQVVLSTKIRKFKVSNTTRFFTLLFISDISKVATEAAVTLECRLFQPGNASTLWEGTVEGKADEGEINQKTKDIPWNQLHLRDALVVRKAVDRAIGTLVTRSGIREISARLRSDAYAKAVKSSQEAEAAGKLPQALQLYAEAYSLADTEDRSMPIMKAIARVTRTQPERAALPEEARRYGVQATSFVEKKRYDEALALYDHALELAPWWAEGHFNRALVAASQNRYREALTSMKYFIALAPNSPDARSAQDKIYEWELEKK